MEPVSSPGYRSSLAMTGLRSSMDGGLDEEAALSLQSESAFLHSTSSKEKRMLLSQKIHEAFKGTVERITSARTVSAFK
ncbi:hypothetical protein Ahy_B02g061439 [Arachis hypogaea]|uniref:Uncharacterized protein n=1 Tax=Arachis hypogaea TaxID=3818 RepID=A0A445AKY0_ARAHY|nr:hypothetical protein Ahy_B02g061439 [Arachis hypogaea]